MNNVMKHKGKRTPSTLIRVDVNTKERLDILRKNNYCNVILSYNDVIIGLLMESHKKREI